MAHQTQVVTRSLSRRKNYFTVDSYLLSMNHCCLQCLHFLIKHKVPLSKKTFCPRLEMMKLATFVKLMQQCFWSESECTTKTVPAEIRKCRPENPPKLICDVWQLYSFISDMKLHCPVQVGQLCFDVW